MSGSEDAWFAVTGFERGEDWPGRRPTRGHCRRRATGGTGPAPPGLPGPPAAWKRRFGGRSRRLSRPATCLPP